MTELEFNALAAQGYNRIPLLAQSFADLDTPLSLYLKLARNQAYSFLLESVVGGERFGRYSFIGLPASTRLQSTITPTGSSTEVIEHGKVIELHQGNPLDFLVQYQARFKTALPPNMPRFCGGLAGYFGYDVARVIEKKLSAVHKLDGLDTPDILLLQTEELAVVDNLAGKITLIVYANPHTPNALAQAQARLAQLKQQLAQPIDVHSFSISATPSGTTEPLREFAKADYLRAAQQAKDYIEAGDLMQVQVGQRIALPFVDEPLMLYRALRTLNPSPYMYYYHMGNHHVVGASPEILVRQEKREIKTEQGTQIDNIVTLRPIAGTRPRGSTPAHDVQLAAELLADEKEIAEHVMLIDLARNDIGRIAKIGSVKVIDKMVIERYSHVMHIVSAVEGTLLEGLSNIDVLKATFPAGTLTGAPKVRAMEMIDELEPSKRGIYGGAVGYLSFGGEMDVAIAIRTAVIQNQVLYAQAAAGVVADSEPEKEWQETEAKARAVLRAAEQVQVGLENELGHGLIK